MLKFCLIKTPHRYFCNSLATTKIRQIVEPKTFTQDEVDLFSMLTGDNNPIHLETTPQSQRLVQGALLNAVLDSITTKLIGRDGILLEKNVCFSSPCYVNKDTSFKVRLIKDRKISVVDFECLQGSNVILRGDAKLLVRKRAKVKDNTSS